MKLTSVEITAIAENIELLMERGKELQKMMEARQDEIDARRYRWLRAQKYEDGGYWVANGIIGIGVSQWNGEPLDTAIDEALKCQS